MVATILSDGENASCGTLPVAAVVDRPCSITVGAGGTVSQVMSTYNSGGYVTQKSNLARGSTYAMTQATYYSSGMLATITDTRNNKTIYN